MNYSREEYEKKILASPLFSLDKDTQPSLYASEAYKMVEYLYCYTLAMCPRNENYEEYACEIVEVAKSCISNFSSEKGEFLHYYNSAWKQEYGHITGRELLSSSYGGLKFSGEEAREIKRYFKFASANGFEVDSAECIQAVSAATGKSQEEVAHIAELAINQTVSDIAYDDDGAEISLFDTLESKDCSFAFLENHETAASFLNRLEQSFDELQSRQKPLISELITAKICEIIVGDEELKKLAEGKTFFSRGVYDYFLTRHKILTAREIAARFGRDEASVSASWKSFKKKIGNH